MRRKNDVMFKIAARYAFSKQNRHRASSILIMLGICFSVLALLMVIAFMEASQDKRLGEIKDIESFHLQVSAQGLTYDDLLAYLTEIDRLPGVEQAFLFADVPAVLKDISSGRSAAVRLRGCSVNAYAEGPLAGHLYTLLGSLPQGDEENVAPSYSLMRSLSLSLDDSLELTVLRPGKTVRMAPYLTDCGVAGIYRTGLPEHDQQTVLMSLAGIRKLTADGDLKIGVFLSERYVDDQRPIIHEIEALGVPSAIQTWQDANSSLYAAMMLEKYMMYLVIGIMILIIITNLKNSTERLLRVKQREMAVLRTMGSRRKELGRIFVLQALVIAGLGVLLGVVLAVLLVHQTPNILKLIDTAMVFGGGGQGQVARTQLTLTLDPVEVLVVASVILVLSGLLAWTGSRKLLSNDIMEILLHDN